MGMRMRDGSMEVATDIYTKGSKVIAVVGVCHVAEPSYWEVLTRRISGYESMGYSVQYEKVRNDLPDGAESPLATVKLYEKLAEISSLKAQSEGLEYKSHWRNTDITMSQFMEFADISSSLTKMVSEAGDTLDKMAEKTDKERLERDIRSFLCMIPVIHRFVPKNKKRDAIIIDLRNTVAADAMLNAEGNVVSIWGAGHLKGIGELLEDEGFSRESRVWSAAVNKSAIAA